MIVYLLALGACDVLQARCASRYWAVRYSARPALSSAHHWLLRRPRFSLGRAFTAPPAPVAKLQYPVPVSIFNILWRCSACFVFFSGIRREKDQALD